MIEVLIVAAAALVALGVGWYAQQRAPDVPLSVSHTVPDQVNRADFDRPDAPWLVAIFTSETCETCAKVLQAAEPLNSTDVVVQDLEVTAAAELHERYKITAVPSVVIADHAGVTQAHYLGPPTTADLWAKLAELRAGA